MTPVVFGLCATAVLAVVLREQLQRWVREAMAARPATAAPVPSTGPYREAGGTAKQSDPSAPPLFAQPPETVYRRNRLTYAAIVVGGPLALANVLIVPFYCEPGPQQLFAVLLGVAIPFATTIGARINSRQPTIPEGLATWSVLSHGMLVWNEFRAVGEVGLFGVLAAYAVGHAMLTVVAARAEPIPVPCTNRWREPSPASG